MQHTARIQQVWNKSEIVDSFFLQEHIPTLDGHVPEQKRDLPPPNPAITTKEEFFKLPMYKDIDTYILAVRFNCYKLFCDGGTFGSYLNV